MEVSIGKRNVNCLSCAPDLLPDDLIPGIDGKLYKAAQHSIQDNDSLIAHDYP